MWSRTPMVKCRMPIVLIVSEADTAGVPSAASVIGVLPCDVAGGCARPAMIAITHLRRRRGNMPALGGGALDDYPWRGHESRPSTREDFRCYPTPTATRPPTS